MKKSWCVFWAEK